MNVYAYLPDLLIGVWVVTLFVRMNRRLSALELTVSRLKSAEIDSMRQ